jgi:hypothetical protein
MGMKVVGSFLETGWSQRTPIYELEEKVHVEIAVIPVDMLKNVFTSFEHCAWTPGFATVSTLCDVDCLL